MSEERSLHEEARELLAAARVQLRDWIEEGVESFERLPDPPARPAQRPAPKPAAPAAATPSSPTPPPISSAPAAPRPVPQPARAQTSLIDDGPGWGPEPSLEEVREALGECTRCGLCSGRTQIVFGVGDPQADLMFVGEGPGEQEDLQGIPFVGRAGELLTAMIEKGLEIPRSSVYICNIVKCRPPGNRTPLPDEVAACRPFLDGQIDAVRPRVIVALGKPASSLMLGRDVAITRMRGTWQQYRGIPLMPTFHPAFILRQYTPENRRLVWEDLKAALARARGADS